ncbi:MAG: Ig-like domain-containing protein [Desulfobacterales bacterium]|nr:Ig-like domain-containing protein [Desulfobacterales bacterium]
MKKFKKRQTHLIFMSILSVFLITGCGGSGGGGHWDEPAPISVVTSTVPFDGATGVPIGNRLTVAFTEPMDPATINTTTFILKQGAAPVSGIVSYSGLVATFTPLSDLAPLTTYTATITAGAKNLDGNPLAQDYSWSFTTGAAPDTTSPRVTLTVPVNGALLVPIANTITATFSEDMDPLSITAATFTVENTTLGGIAVAGSVIYSVAARTATFTPTSSLAANTLFTATINTFAEDLAGNALAGNQAPLPAASDYVWTFTTGAAPDTTAPTVTLTDPADLDVGVCLNKTINATFSEAMDPLTLNIATFTLQASGPPLGPVLAGTVTYDLVTNVASLKPTADLAANTSYTATITTGAKDLAGNALAVNEVWTFTTGATICTEPVALGAATPFGGFGGGAGVTNQGTLTIVNGDLGTTGVSTTVTGFQDSVGDLYTITPLNDGMVNGRIYTDAPPPGGAGVGGNAVTKAIADAAAADALIAYNNLSPAGLPGGADVGNNLGGLTLAPGIYLAPAPGSTFLLTVADLTLDGQGDANAVWVFQAPASLTIGAPGFPRSINLINGAQAKNVFWYVGSAARIEDQCNMVGTIIASAGVTISTAGQLATTTLDGRALGLYASVTMVNTLVNVPAP